MRLNKTEGTIFFFALEAKAQGTPGRWIGVGLTQTVGKSAFHKPVFPRGFEINAEKTSFDVGMEGKPAVFDILQICARTRCCYRTNRKMVKSGLDCWIDCQYARETQRRRQHRAVIVGAQANKDTESRHAKHYSQFGRKTFGRPGQQ